MPDPATELLETMRKVADTQALMARRQRAMEQLVEGMRHDFERWQQQMDQTAGFGAKIAVLEYQVAQQAEQLRSQGTRLSLLLPAILILLAVLAIAAALSFVR